MYRNRPVSLALVALVRRDGEVLIPRGNTVPRLGDRLSIVGAADGIRAVRSKYGSVSDLEIPDFISEEMEL